MRNAKDWNLRTIGTKHGSGKLTSFVVLFNELCGNYFGNKATCLVMSIVMSRNQNIFVDWSLLNFSQTQYSRMRVAFV